MTDRKRPETPSKRVIEGYQPDDWDCQHGYQPSAPGPVDLTKLKPPSGDTAVSPPVRPAPSTPKDGKDSK